MARTIFAGLTAFGKSFHRHGQSPFKSVSFAGLALARTLFAFVRIMLRDTLRSSLKHLGINDSNYKVLKLLPLIYVAWADGKIEPAQERRLLDLAHNHFQIGKSGEAILARWIRERPAKEYILEGLHDVVLLALAPDEGEFDLDELQGLLSHAEAIARTTAEAMDAPTAVDSAEEAALETIARELGVDDGESWAALMRELQAESEAT